MIHLRLVLAISCLCLVPMHVVAGATSSIPVDLFFWAFFLATWVAAVSPDDGTY